MSGSSNVRLPRVAAVWVAPSWLAVALSVLVVTSHAWAGDECQEIQLDGIAGGSGGTVTIRVVDGKPDGVIPLILSGDVISTSCAISIPPDEPAASLIRRIPEFWGNGDGGTPPTDVQCTLDFDTKVHRQCTAGGNVGSPCATDVDCDGSELGAGICGKQPKKSCVLHGDGAPPNPDDSLPACTIEAKVTQVKGKCDAGPSIGMSCSKNSQCPSPGVCPGADTLGSCPVPADKNYTCIKKRTLKICCREHGCSGAKLAGLGTNIPISVQTQGVAECPTLSNWCPAEIPSDNLETIRFDTDPIDGRPGPYASQRECKSALQTAAGALTQTVFQVLKDCMAGTFTGSCATVNPTSDPAGAVATASTALRTAIQDGCAQSGRSPSDFGFTSCPAPCDTIKLAVCSAGRVVEPEPCQAGIVGTPQRNRFCDTTPGAGDGVCGDWSTFKDCTVCSATAAGEAAIAAAYVGSAARSTTAREADTAAAHGRVGRSLTASAKNCQNHIGDGIATLLKAELKDAAKCQKNLDAFKIMLSDSTPKCKDADHKRVRAKARDAIAVDLTSACTTAALGELDTCSSNMAGLLACAPRIVRHVTAAVGDAAAPEGRCGDGRQGSGETCDDGNTIDGDGCDSNCTVTACGNGVISTGEQCDDGNQVNGDGCDLTCLSEPQPCDAQMCTTGYTFDCSKLFPGDCVCLRAADGSGGSCVNNFNCATAQPCNTSGECPPGETCYLDTCCTPPGAGGICGPGKCTAP
jgi:cysteine-rich repeat protein